MDKVEVLKQSSWGTTRDNLVLGSQRNGIDGAHILSPMPYLISTGAVTPNNVPVPMAVVARLNLAGQCISVGAEYLGLKLGLDAKPFAKALAAKAAGGKPVNAAMTFPGGTHDLWIRYWLAAGGIDPDKDVQTIVVPPPQMVANMKVGTMDAFCVGEPWPAQTVNQKLGYTAAVTGELWKDHPEKAFALRADWVKAHPRAAEAMTAAVIEAQRWCDADANKAEMCAIIGKRAWFNVPVADILERSRGNIDYGDGRKVESSPLLMKFWRDNASFPFASHDLWFLTEDIRWGVLPENTDTRALVAQVNRADVWRAAAARAGVPDAEVPQGDSRGVETFFDGKRFDPANPRAYLDSLSIKKLAGA